LYRKGVRGKKGSEATDELRFALIADPTFDPNKTT
jgi:hypothetical protein